eukprot:13398410-Alexandrium_andersonii.AAC.1
MLTKAVNGDTIGKRTFALGVHWEGGRAASAPLLDGFSWDRLGPNCGSPESGPVSTDAAAPRVETRTEQPKVSWAEVSDAH